MKSVRGGSTTEMFEIELFLAKFNFHDTKFYFTCSFEVKDHLSLRFSFFKPNSKKFVKTKVTTYTNFSENTCNVLISLFDLCTKIFAAKILKLF